MNKLDVSSPFLELTPAPFPDRDPARCLIVLVPESGVDTALAARKIWELANALECRVQFLGLSKDAALESGLRRQLATLSAMVADKNIFAESKIEFGGDWQGVVRSNFQKGDVIVCFAEQPSGFGHKPLNQILESNLKATIFLLAGCYEQEYRPRSNWMFNAMEWAGSIGIMLGFFWLQSKLSQFPADGAHATLLYISLFVEAGLIWVWISFFGTSH